MQPSKKSEEIENLLTSITGSDRRQTIRQNVCVSKPIGCGKPITGFKDKISEKEYTISGLCQECQDKIFG